MEEVTDIHKRLDNVRRQKDDATREGEYRREGRLWDQIYILEFKEYLIYCETLNKSPNPENLLGIKKAKQDLKHKLIILANRQLEGKILSSINYQ